MIIQIASDLHLERYENSEIFERTNLINPVGEILVLAGDICNIHKKDDVKYFFDFCKDNFKKVIHIPGNHEYYGNFFNTIDDAIWINEDNYTYCNNQNLVIDGVRFICSTLWSGVSDRTPSYIGDYHVIGGFTKEVENNAHDNAKKFIETNLAVDFDGPTVVVTHHLPLLDCIDEEYKGSFINDAFASDQSDLFDYKIDAWIHGHSHTFQEFTHKDTKVIRNPFGYIGVGNETRGFVNECTIEV